MKYEDFRATFVEAIEVFTAQVYNTGEMLIRDDRGSQAKPQCGILGNKNKNVTYLDYSLILMQQSQIPERYRFSKTGKDFFVLLQN